MVRIQNKCWLTSQIIIDVNSWNFIHHFGFAFEPTELWMNWYTEHSFVSPRRVQVFKVRVVAANVVLDDFDSRFWVVNRGGGNSANRGLLARGMRVRLDFAGCDLFNIYWLNILVWRSLHLTVRSIKVFVLSFWWVRTRIRVVGVFPRGRWVTGRVFSRATDVELKSFHSLKLFCWKLITKNLISLNKNIQNI